MMDEIEHGEDYIRKYRQAILNEIDYVQNF
jgi:hypothetical protein